MNESQKLYSQEGADQLKEVFKTFLITKAEGNGTFEVVATTDMVDRDGEIIKADSWELEPYQKNPVLLWAHNYSLPPIGSVTSFVKQGNAWIAKGIFANTDFAQQIRQLYDDGIVRTVSVGFIPKERQGNVITRAELLELSFVPVPANSEALTLRRMADFEKMVTKTFGKGAVQDNLTAASEETFDIFMTKHACIEAIFTSCQAFASVVMRPETPMEDIEGLKVELTEIIKALAISEIKPNIEDENNELYKGAVGKCLLSEEFKQEQATKSGRVLSGKTVTKIQSALDAMKTVSDGLEELLSLQETEKEVSKVIEKSELEDLQMISRILDKTLEGFHRSLKKNLQ